MAQVNLWRRKGVRPEISFLWRQLEAAATERRGPGSQAYEDHREVRLWLSVIAHNLGNLWRRLVLPLRVGNWSLTSLQPRLVKTGGRLVKHARYYWLLLAEGHLTRRLFGAMVRRIERLAAPAG